MTPGIAFRLGRVSNLPTVWSNVLAGTALAGGAGVSAPALVALMIAMSLFYVGGMWLNDAFDAEIDARERPERPIPSGAVSRAVVFHVGFGLLAAGEVMLVATAYVLGAGAWQLAGIAGLALAAAILFYDWHHKANPLSPLVMGLCRMLVYIAAGLTVARVLPAGVAAGALALLSYLIGLTYTAKQENLNEIGRLWPLGFLALPVGFGLFSLTGFAAGLTLAVLVAWIARNLLLVFRRAEGDIPRAVGGLIAGISLVDALLIVLTGAWVLAGVAVGCFALTLGLQRFVPGT